MAALGKGLGSLIPNKTNQPTQANINTKGASDFKLDEEVIDTSGKKIVYLSLDKIVANPWQPRTQFDEEKLNELAESIKKHGILQPLVVSHEPNGTYQLIAGERRLRASQLLQLEEVPAIVREVTDRDKLELSIIENIQRQNLNPIEEAASYKRLMEEFGMTTEEISKQVGRNKSTIANYVRVLSLPIVVKEALSEGKIAFSHALYILSYPTKLEQVKIFKKVLKENLNTQQLEDLTKKAAHRSNKNKPRDPVLASWEDKLTKSLGAKTTIDKRGEKGSIKITFYSHSELKGILDKLE